MSSLDEVRAIYDGSNGEATKALYVRLEALGPIGVVAVNLFRAQKNSERAKVYRGRGHRSAAYDTKQWAMMNLCNTLLHEGTAAGFAWGWGIDDEQPVHRHVLYVELPTGQVSFHTDHRGSGPDQPHPFDGQHGRSPWRIVQWVAQLLDGNLDVSPAPAEAKAGHPPLPAEAVPIAAKVDHVLAEARNGRTREHHCHWPGCTRQVPPAMWGCKEHWARLPQAMRRKIWRTYQPGQEKTGTPSAEYVAAAREVRDWCLAQERQAQQGRLL